MRVHPPSLCQKASLLAVGRGERSELSDLETDGNDLGTSEREHAKDAWALNSPLRKALASLLELLGKKDQELIRESDSLITQ